VGIACEIHLQKLQNSNITAAILNNSQQPGSFLFASFRPRDLSKWLPDSFKIAASEVAYFKINVLRIAGTSDVLTSVREKAECTLAVGEEQKVSFGAIFSFKRTSRFHDFYVKRV